MLMNTSNISEIEKKSERMERSRCKRGIEKFRVKVSRIEYTMAASKSSTAILNKT